jgi:hypothetical protein
MEPAGALALVVPADPHAYFAIRNSFLFLTELGQTISGNVGS